MAPMRFDGDTYVPVLDEVRLTGQWLRVFTVMCDQQWRTLREIADATGDPEASISARLRDFRKPRFGGCIVKRQHRGELTRGLYEYQLLPPPEPDPAMPTVQSDLPWDTQ